MFRDPCQHFGAQAAWPFAFGFQAGQNDDHVETATDQMHMRRTMIALAHFKPILVVAKALLRGHGNMV